MRKCNCSSSNSTTRLICIFYSYHSVEARNKMDRYRIGRIEGRWENFVPPLQGGKFRPYKETASDTEEEEDMETRRTSTDVSRTPSPVFDTQDSDIRQRRSSRKDPVLSSASSVSSITEPDYGMSHFDAETKEAIDLDIAKYPSLDLATQDEVIRKYRQLDERLRAEGFYDCNYTAYVIEACRYIFLLCMMLLFL